MKLSYQKPKGQRVKWGFWGMYCRGYWWNKDHKEWQKTDDLTSNNFSNSKKVKTVRAFRRALKSAPFGSECILSSRFVAYDVFGRGGKNGL